MTNQITPCLWFDFQAEEAVNFYTSIFRNSRIENISRYQDEGFEIHKQEKGKVLAISFQINGQPFTALNGGPVFSFSPAISFQIFCETQDEIDDYWTKLTEGGMENNCGWLTDKYGVSWQIIPTILPQLMSDPNKAGNVMKAFLQMKKFDIETLKNASIE